MTRLECINSSSAGNCFILDCEGEKLILDLGVEWRKIEQCLRYDISTVVGCLVTHNHLDHSKSISNALKYFLDVYSCPEVCEAFDGAQALSIGKKTRIGGFMVQPIPLTHNVENYGFIITHEALGKLVYAVDCSQFQYKIKDVNHWILEANYDAMVMIDHFFDNKVSRSHNENHLSISQTLDALDVNANENTKTIVLAHLSDDNSNEADFKRRVTEKFPNCNCYIADRYLSIYL